jgi:nucleotide-binding universal stress UspA family protein
MLWRQRRNGDHSKQIVQFAEANRIDLIVICTRGRSGLSRWLMGSVADRVVRGASVPVLLVQTEGAEVYLAEHATLALASHFA